MPNTPLSELVDYINSDYTSWDEGQTWRQDPNTHFEYEEETYYIQPGEDINDRSTWKVDTMRGQHMTRSEYLTRELNNRQHQATLDFNRQMLEEIRKRNEMQERWLKEERERLVAEQAKMEAEAAAIKAKEERRVKLAGLGRKATLLTGGDGLPEMAPVYKKTLGAV